MSRVEMGIKPRVRENPCGRRAHVRPKSESPCPGFRLTHRHRNLASRDGQSHVDRLGRRLPQHVAHLIVEGQRLVGLVDMLVVTKSIHKLRSVDLTINGLKHPLLEVLRHLGTLRFGTHVTTTPPAPAPSQGLQGPQMCPRVV